MTDLWPANIINVENMTAPVRILKEQAALLGQKTKNLVKAKVVPEKKTVYKPGAIQPRFQYSFYIVAPLLENYQYRLFTIYHDIEFYPVNFILDEAVQEEIFLERQEPEIREKEILVYSEDDFVEILRKIFNSQKATKVIQSILLQSGNR